MGEFCATCVATTPEARAVVVKILALQGDQYFDPDGVAIFFSVDVEAAQEGINCLHRREFDDCMTRQLYTTNVDVIESDN